MKSTGTIYACSTFVERDRLIRITLSIFRLNCSLERRTFFLIGSSQRSNRLERERYSRYLENWKRR